jgi:hypothetical protein
MRWLIARNWGGTPTGSTAPVQAAGAEVRLLPTNGDRGDPPVPVVPPFTDHAVTRTNLAAERVAVVIFGLNLTLAALMLYVMIRHAGRTPGLAADGTAQVELRGFAGERKTAVLLQASAAVVGLLLPVIAVIFYLAVSLIYLIEPFREGGYSRTAHRHAREILILVCWPRWRAGRPWSVLLSPTSFSVSQDKNRRNLRLQPAGPSWTVVILAPAIPPVPRPHSMSRGSRWLSSAGRKPCPPPQAGRRRCRI